MLNCFSLVLWAYLLTDSEFSCLAMLAKPYPLSGPTPMPLLPHQLRRIQISALEVIGAILEARLQPELRFKSIFFVECIVFRLASAFTQHLLLSAALL